MKNVCGLIVLFVVVAAVALLAAKLPHASDAAVKAHCDELDTGNVAASPEVKSEDVVLREYEGSPSKISEEIWATSDAKVPEQWHVTAWKDGPWWFDFTLFGNDKGDAFSASIFSQRKGTGFSEPDVFGLFDTNEDGKVDTRSLWFRSPRKQVGYRDLNMDGFLDIMQVNNEYESKYYIC